MDAAQIVNLQETTALWLVANSAFDRILNHIIHYIFVLGCCRLPCRIWTLLDINFPGVGSVQSLLPHPLHHEVAWNSADPASVPHVQAGLEIQGVNS